MAEQRFEPKPLRSQPTTLATTLHWLCGKKIYKPSKNIHLLIMNTIGTAVQCFLNNPTIRQELPNNLAICAVTNAVYSSLQPWGLESYFCNFLKYSCDPLAKTDRLHKKP